MTLHTLGHLRARGFLGVDAQPAGNGTDEYPTPVAAARMVSETPGHTLDPTALVHEAYLRLVGDQQFDGREHFFASAAEAMRRILVDHARRKAAEKRGGGLRRIDLPDVPTDPDAADPFLALDTALTRLAAEDPIAARVVELRQFAGLGHEQVAAALGVTVYVARQKWAYARAWLRDAMGH